MNVVFSDLSIITDQDAQIIFFTKRYGFLQVYFLSDAFFGAYSFEKASFLMYFQPLTSYNANYIKPFQRRAKPQHHIKN
jgi:hypothetical protein